jgi:hypothetical protein
VSGQLHAPAALPPREISPPLTNWIEGWVDPRASLDDMEKLRFLTLQGLELRTLDLPARSQSLYGLRYRGSLFRIPVEDKGYERSKPEHNMYSWGNAVKITPQRLWAKTCIQRHSSNARARVCVRARTPSNAVWTLFVFKLKNLFDLGNYIGFQNSLCLFTHSVCLKM